MVWALPLKRMRPRSSKGDEAVATQLRRTDLPTFVSEIFGKALTVVGGLNQLSGVGVYCKAEKSTELSYSGTRIDHSRDSTEQQPAASTLINSMGL